MEQKRKFGRPTKPKNECRTVGILVRLTEKERVTLERMAVKRNCTMNDVFRTVLQPVR